MIPKLLLIAHTIAVSWAAPQQSIGFTTQGYYVFRAIDGAAPVRRTSVTGTSYNDINTASGHTYCYQIAPFGTGKVKGQTQTALLVAALSKAACVNVK